MGNVVGPQLKQETFKVRQSWSAQTVLWLLTLFVGVLLLAPSGARAQEFRGTISGLVTDMSGAVIPGAQVTVRETSTGAVNHTVSDSAGQYVVPFLLPGGYTVTVTAKGFQTLVRSNIKLESQEHTVINVKLKVGSVSQTVRVSSAPPLLNVANASVGAVITTRSVANLPLNGRAPTTLAELAPGVISTGPPQQIHPFDNNAGNQWSIGGTPNQVSEVLLDGSPDLTLLGAVAYEPTEDSVAEVSVRPFDTDASFGHTIGGVINMVTKSGTNSFHGTMYEFGQISGIDANTYFNDRSGKPTPTFHYNQYGLTIGGPVLIPKVFNGRNKLFFFFAWEGLKDSTPNTQTQTVPTAAEKTGDFSQTLAAGCPAGFANDPSTAAAICNPSGKNASAYADPNQLYNPFTAQEVGKNIVRQPIFNNQLTSVGSLSSIAQSYLKLFPAPNNTVGAAADGQDNYISNAPSVDNYDNEFGRIDWNMNARDHMFFDIRHNNRLQIKNNYFGNGTTGSTLTRENFGASLDNVFSLNPTTIFDTRFNWTWFNEVHGTPATAFTPASLGFPSYMTSASRLLQLPYINFQTGSSCGKFTSYQCLGDTGSALDPTTSYQVFADMVKVIGRQTLKIGFDGRQYRMSVQNFGDSSGSFSFNSNFVTAGTGAADQTFGGDLADFEFGFPSGGEFDLNSRADYHQYYVGAFVQDDWRVNDRLSLNMGLRFDIDTPFREKSGATVNGFNPNAAINYTTTPAFAGASVTQNGQTFTVASINTAGGLTFPGVPNGAVYKNNSGFFSPRFGFSFMIDPKTVLRGGFGTFVQSENLATLAATGTYSSSALSNQEGYSAATDLVSTTNNNLTPNVTLDNPFPNGFAQPDGDALGANTFLGQAINFIAPYEHDPYSERWDIGIQRSLNNNTMLEVLYVGNHALHLPVASQNLNAMQAQYLNHNPFLDENRSKAYGQSVTNPFYQTLGATNITSLNKSKTVSIASLMGAFPQFGTSDVTQENAPIGQSYFQSGILYLRHRTSHGLTLTANYSFSKLIEADTFLNNVDTVPTRRISPFDVTHHFTVGATYALPFGSGQLFSLGNRRLWDEIAGGWVINGVYQFQSGMPIEFSTDIPLQPGTSLRQIHNSARNTSPVGSGSPALNTSLFVTGNSTSCPSAGACDGSAFINGQYKYHYRTFPQTLSWVRQDGYNNLDASILKDFHFTEHSYFQLRFEIFNTLNHPIFAAPNISSATSSDFGYITSTTKNSLPRQIQIGGRLVF